MQRGVDYIGVGVGAVIVNNEGKILLALRGPEAKNERGTWEIPGGGIEFNETIEQALKREIKEELGVDIEIVRLLNVWDHILPAEHQHWISPTYITKITKGTPEVKEKEKCDALGWFTLGEAQKLPLSQITKNDVAHLLAHYPGGRVLL